MRREGKVEGRSVEHNAEMTSPAREDHHDQLVSGACTAQCSLRPLFSMSVWDAAQMLLNGAILAVGPR